MNKNFENFLLIVKYVSLKLFFVFGNHLNINTTKKIVFEYVTTTYI